MSWRRPRRSLRPWAALAAFVSAMALGPATAPALTLVPPKPNVFFGVSDRGSTAEFNEFGYYVRKHPALLQTFHPWGNSLNAAYERWRETATRPILHISTADDQTLAEIITPQQIALGGGDDYLLQLNDFLAVHGPPAYIRPLGEPNRCLNPWSPVNCDGSRKGGEHTAGWYKQAFRRIALIVRGGQTLAGLNVALARIGLPPLKRSKGPNPTALPAAPVSMIWSPLPGGSPRVRGNGPGNYWPGARFVDWVGTDLYSQYPVWKDLNRFFRGRHWRGKPFSLTEWAVAGEDDPRFVKRLIAWTVRRKRVRMLVYYRGFGDTGNPYALGAYPRTTNTLRRKIRRASFLAYADYNAATLPPLPKKANKGKSPAPPATPTVEPSPTP